MKKIVEFASSPPSESDYEAAESVGHFYAVDFLRGLAAVTILIWHYQHFFMGKPLLHGSPSMTDMTIARSDEPLYSLLWPFYEHGYWAVQAFWIISGFVFAHVYAEKQTRAADFALARFARLYPLNVVTLLFVTVVQWVSRHLLGGYQIVTFNDIYHFFLNLFYVNAWNLGLGQSFNFPTWSVSVELGIYALFYLVSRRIFAFGMVLPLVITGFGAAITNQGTPLWYFGMCLFFFFQGVLAYYLLIRLRNRPSILIVGCIISEAIFAGICLSGKFQRFQFPNIEGLLFLPIIMLAAMSDMGHMWLGAKKSVRWLGDATYSLYLWHFPIQIVILVVVQLLGIDVAYFRSPWVLLCWIVGMIVVSVISFRLVEKPLQKWSKAIIVAAAEKPARNRIH